VNLDLITYQLVAISLPGKAAKKVVIQLPQTVIRLAQTIRKGAE